MPQVRWGTSCCAFQQTESSCVSSCTCPNYDYSGNAQKHLERRGSKNGKNILTRRCRRPLSLPPWLASCQCSATRGSNLDRQSLCPTATNQKCWLGNVAESFCKSLLPNPPSLVFFMQKCCTPICFRK